MLLKTTVRIITRMRTKSTSRACSMHGGRIAHQRSLFSTMDAASSNACSFSQQPTCSRRWLLGMERSCSYIYKSASSSERAAAVRVGNSTFVHGGSKCVDRDAGQ
jgi:hypothetical protein